MSLSLIISFKISVTFHLNFSYAKKTIFLLSGLKDREKIFADGKICFNKYR